MAVSAAASAAVRRKAPARAPPLRTTYTFRSSASRRSGRRMKSRRPWGSRASTSRRCPFASAGIRLPATGSRAQRPWYSTSSQWSTRLAVAPTSSPACLDVSAQNGLKLAAIRVLRHDADHLPGRHRLAPAHRQLGPAPREVRDDLVLHLHRLDDAEHLACLDDVALGHVDGKHGALHRADDGVPPAGADSGGCQALATPAREPGIRRLQDAYLHV